MKIKVSQACVDHQEVEAVERVLLKDGYFGMGQEVRAFEDELRTYFGAERDVACVSTGTSALHLAVMSCVQPGEEVLVQSLTYVASFQAISAAGAIPVACEVDAQTCAIDLVDAEKRLTSKTRAIMPVHYMGSPGPLDDIYAFAKKHQLRVIEDAAHAFGSRYHNQRIGSFGDIACFSFDSIKNITSGEGGIVVSADDDVMRFVKDARLLGVQKDTQKRYEGKRSWEFETTHQGYRYHMSNISAAIGRVQLEKFSGFAEQRQSLAKYYQGALKDISGVECFSFSFEDIVPHIFVVKVGQGQRDALRDYLAEQGIECGVHYYPNHMLDYYKGAGDTLPVTEDVYSQILTLPLHCHMTISDVDAIVAHMASFIKTISIK